MSSNALKSLLSDFSIFGFTKRYLSYLVSGFQDTQQGTELTSLFARQKGTEVGPQNPLTSRRKKGYI